ncbi:tyrosine-protein phosphatase [Aquamicrobium sp.]|uniref:tyrosine-protein phosphatase n=1 Tax=Aquamicrobium sp. TaxID=1872579 RepID=UPI00338DCA13
MAPFAAADGRILRTGRLFRCGSLHIVSDVGLTDMAGLGLQVFFDLRSNEERATRPARLPKAKAPRRASAITTERSARFSTTWHCQGSGRAPQWNT